MNLKIAKNVSLWSQNNNRNISMCEFRVKQVKFIGIRYKKKLKLNSFFQIFFWPIIEHLWNRGLVYWFCCLRNFENYSHWRSSEAFPSYFIFYEGLELNGKNNLNNFKQPQKCRKKCCKIISKKSWKFTIKWLKIKSEKCQKLFLFLPFFNFNLPVSV